jgi:hypothetical protein
VMYYGCTAVAFSYWTLARGYISEGAPCVLATGVDPERSHQPAHAALRHTLQQGAALAVGGRVIKCPSPLHVLKYTYDRSFY